MCTLVKIYRRQRAALKNLTEGMACFKVVTYDCKADRTVIAKKHIRNNSYELYKTTSSNYPYSLRENQKAFLILKR